MFNEPSNLLHCTISAIIDKEDRLSSKFAAAHQKIWLI